VLCNARKADFTLEELGWRLAPGVPDGARLFFDQDETFFAWLDEHMASFFLNTTRPSAARRLLLHRAPCPNYRPDGSRFTHAPKLCSTNRASLERWARDALGRTPDPCSGCNYRKALASDRSRTFTGPLHRLRQ
jgi:hypothetical protein